MTLQHSILGTLYKGGEYDLETGDVITEPTPVLYKETELIAFHVNSLEPIPGADGYAVDPAPAKPRVVYIGAEQGVVTYFYAFPDEATFRTFIPAPEELTDEL